MSKQLTPNVKGTRDFYPEDFAVRQWLYKNIQKVSHRFGYQEFDGPMIEYLDLYTDKTSEEILKDQTFSLKDRDDRDLVLRPEITPTFARMVAQRAHQLPRIVRWFSFARAWRYEQPQKGRGREFFQWEINLLGPESPAADAEILAIAVEFFKQLGLNADQVVIRVSDRSYFDQSIKQAGIDGSKYLPLLRAIDRKEKISQDEFDQLLLDQGLNHDQVSLINNYLSNPDYSGSEWLTSVFKALDSFPNVKDYIKYDPIITRGFDYYTRTVFEAWDKTGGLRRALFGGGRFDNLTETLGGERVPGVGMAPGDMPVLELLNQFKLLPQIKPEVCKVLVTVFSGDLLAKSLEIGSQLRSQDIATEVWLGDPKLDKQFKYADQKEIPYVVVVGPDEAANNRLTLKTLATSQQENLSLEEAITKIKAS